MLLQLEDVGSFFVVFLQATPNEADCQVAQSRGIDEVLLVEVDDLHQSSIAVFCLEWRLSGEHFVDGTAERPDICVTVVLLALNDFRSHPAASPDKGVGLVLLLNNLGRADVSDLNHSVRFDQDVSSFNVPVDHVVEVQVLEG